MDVQPSSVRKTYEFIKGHQRQFPVDVLCRVLQVAPSGYYAWLKKPVSDRGLEDARLLRLIRASFTASQGISGAPRVFLELREAGEGCSKHLFSRKVVGWAIAPTIRRDLVLDAVLKAIRARRPWEASARTSTRPFMSVDGQASLHRILGTPEDGL